jgi:nucleotide-binding universal stress UspA family protein
MYETILVPLDGSKRAERILPHVEELALRFNAKVILLQVEESMVPARELEPDHAAVYLQRLQQHKSKAEAYLGDLQIRLRAKGIETRPSIASGPIAEAILNAAEREGADLVAMASHGRTGLAQVFYGSVAAAVLHRIDRPLLLIRSREAE